MQRIRVKELAVPLSAYATVRDQATFSEAIIALHCAQNEFDPNRPRHRAILVLDSNQQVVGKIGFLQVLQGLEPKYAGVDREQYMGGTFTSEFIKSQLEKYALLQSPLDDICRKAAQYHVKEFMYVPKESEFIDEEATLDEAIHQFITIREQSLLMRRGKTVTGILRLSDVVERICQMIKACGVST